MADDDVVGRRGAVQKWGAQKQPGDHTTPKRTKMFHGIAVSACAGTPNWASFDVFCASQRAHLETTTRNFPPLPARHEWGEGRGALPLNYANCGRIGARTLVRFPQFWLGPNAAD